jgi:hypothetical protein
MTPSATGSPFGPEFSDFLFAPIGEDQHEMRLSVLSALARLDIDPWQEAADLSELPRKTATARLAALLARLPSTQPDAGATAARLIELLPQRGGLAVLSRKKFLALGAMTDSQIFIYAIFTGFILAALFNANYQVPPQVDQSPAPASSTASPSQVPPAYGQIR